MWLLQRFDCCSHRPSFLHSEILVYGTENLLLLQTALRHFFNSFFRGELFLGSGHVGPDVYLHALPVVVKASAIVDPPPPEKKVEEGTTTNGQVESLAVCVVDVLTKNARKCRNVHVFFILKRACFCCCCLFCGEQF